MLKLLSKIGLILVLGAIVFLMLGLVTELMLLFPFESAKTLQNNFILSQPEGLSVVLVKAKFYLYMLQHVWLLLLLPVIGVFLYFMLAGKNSKMNRDDYLVRIHDLERRNDGLSSDLNKRLNSLERLSKGLSEAFTGSVDGLMEVGADGRVLSLTNGARNILEQWHNDSQFESRRLGELIPGVEASGMLTALKECILNECSWHGEVRVKDTDNWVFLRVFPSSEGAYIIVRDTSYEHKNQTVDVTTEALMKQLVSFTPHAVAVVNNEWQYIFASKGWHSVFGTDKAILGRAHESVLPEFPNNFSALKAQLLGGHTVQRDEELWNKEGVERWMRWQIRPWEITIGKIGGYLLFADDITEVKETKQRLNQQMEQEHKLAYSDVLTGLPNRQLFYDRLNVALTQAYRHLGKVGLMFLDLDGFKAVNDKLGHDMGDLLLKQVADRLKKCVREADTVARLGGDEFTIILNLNEAGDAEMVAKKVTAEIAKPYDLNGTIANVTTSVGVSLYPANGSSVNDLVRKADTAMYHAKQSGKNQFFFYEETEEDMRAANKDKA